VNLLVWHCAPFATRKHIVIESTVQNASNSRAGRPKESDIGSRDFQLLDVAASLFLDIGYHQVSIDQIVRAAGVAGRTIYARFGGKAGLLEAVIDRELKRQRAHLDSLSERDDSDDATFVALAVVLLEGSLSQDALLLYCDSLAKRDFRLGQRLTEIARGAWRVRLLKILSAAPWLVRCRLECSLEVMADIFIGQVITRHAEFSEAMPGIKLDSTAILDIGQEAVGRFVDIMTGKKWNISSESST
jgi:AcrR family transcriptional regulator